MSKLSPICSLWLVLLIYLFASSTAPGQTYNTAKPNFHVLAFYTAKQDPAHISFVHEANAWFAGMAEKHHFTYDSTDNWNRLHLDSLKNYQVVLFLDTRPEVPAQRRAFEQYMKNGGAWMGFHFAAFALTPSTYPQDWEWYHEEFLGAGSYKSNTWRPTSAVLRVEDRTHAATQGLPETFTSAPNEWYRWENDLRSRPDIQILLSIDSSSFPLGTGPKPHEIWHEGYYPVVWTNRRYRMLYLNMGHNDMDYEGGSNRALSGTFQSETQNQLILNGLCWLGTGTSADSRPDYEKQLRGTWNYVEMRNARGEKIDSYNERFGKVIASGPRITLSEDGTYEMKFTPGKADTGFWAFNEKTMNIEYDLYIDSTTFVGKDLIKRGLAVKHKNGNYYERITEKVLKLEGDELIVDMRGNQRVYKKGKK